jgi:hypothetical protein
MCTVSVYRGRRRRRSGLLSGVLRIHRLHVLVQRPIDGDYRAHVEPASVPSVRQQTEDIIIIKEEKRNEEKREEKKRIR